MNRLDHHQDVFTDLTTLQDIRRDGQKDKAAGVKEMARKFESLFVHMMLKSMREANKGFEDDDFLNSSESEFHRDMYDQQLSVSLTQGRGIGLAEILERQMLQQYGIKPNVTKADQVKQEHAQSGSDTQAVNLRRISSPANATLASKQSPTQGVKSSAKQTDQKATETNAILADEIARDELSDQEMLESEFALAELARTEQTSDATTAEESWLDVMHSDALLNEEDNRQYEAEEVGYLPEVLSDEIPQDQLRLDFINQVYPYAEKAGAELGLDPRVLVAQAALETGWGRAVSKHPDGTSSFNLFNIKAGSGWDGATVNKETLEYRQGVALKERASFRSYDSYQESFADYVKFIQETPRYHKALQQTSDSVSYLRALKNGGYATDPHYVNKILHIIKSPTLKSGITIASSNKEQ